MKEVVSSKTVTALLMSARSMLRQARCPECQCNGLQGGAGKCHWCLERAAVMDAILEQPSPVETTAYTEEAQEIRESAQRDLAYFDGAKQAAAMAHQSLKNMDAWIADDCGGRWTEAKRALAGLPVEPKARQSSVVEEIGGWRCDRCQEWNRHKHSSCQKCGTVKATASLPACECLVRDKAPSAYHNVKCPRYVADLPLNGSEEQ